jgi:hypothetical protein
MRTFLIAYDLAKPNRNKHVLASTIMALGTAWARPLDHTWYVKGDVDETEIERKLAGLLDEDDGLLVQCVESPAALAQTSLRWFRQRRPGFEVGVETNIIAFPSPSVVAAQAELPLAHAS